MHTLKLVLISCRVAKSYVSFFDRWASYAPHNWPDPYVCMKVGCSDMSNSQKGVGKDRLQFTANSERAVT